MSKTQTTPRFPAIVANAFFDTDGHPLNVRRDAGFIIDADGLVVCGQCAVDHAREARGGGWNATNPKGRLEQFGVLAYDPETGDDWCSVCGRDIVN